YRSAADHLREAGYQHAAARASTRDREAGWAAQEAGGRWVDTQVSWMCPLSGVPHDEALPGRLRIESHDRASVADVPESAWRRLSDWGGESFDRGPLVFDLTLPVARARAIYREWTERVMRGDWADAVVIARDGDEVVAFISMLELPDVSDVAGVKVCGRGLGATLPEYRGLFTAIQREMIARQPLGAAWMENETQAATIGSINVYAKLGFRYLRSTGTFHLRLDGAPACE
ncbi:MAG: GNAT family N-acetyltransferase, partial [Myxococcales bacterium]|nr:GNAT family N-acetyltransferase [Myxococcales bacterium]